MTRTTMRIRGEDLVPRPEGTMQLVRLRDIQPGYFLCPAEWETAFRAGTIRIDPWAIAFRRPVTHKVLQPGDPTWRRETTVTCLTPDRSLTMYYRGAPHDYVRVVIPDAMRPDDDRG